MNARTEKRLGIMAASLLTAAMLIAPNPIQQQEKTQFLTFSQKTSKEMPQRIILAQNVFSDKIFR